MAAASFARLQALFADALEVPVQAREGFLRQACGDDPALLDQVRRLLEADAGLAGMTARPAAAGLDTLIAGVAPNGSLVGSVFGPYRLCGALGQGGMGSVYRAERIDGNVRQQVAIKFVRRELLDADTLRRFQLERQTLASLDHPHIARLIDASALAEDPPYFVMDFVDGAPITDYCRRVRLDLRGRLRLFGAVCAAVSHAHRHLVVHRDLKPGNILVTADGLPKLLDFGIAKSLAAVAGSAAGDLTGTGQHYFSPRYAAPEQLLGGPIDVGCDIYALGLLLYELLAEATPFDFQGLSAGQIERLITSVPPPPPSTRIAASAAPIIGAAQLRGDLDAIVLRCLRKASNERYASVERLVDDLTCYLEGRPLGARDGETLYRLRKFVGRHRLSTAVVGVAALALSSALLVLLHQNEALTRERDVSQQSVGLLKDAFAAADPIRASGAEVSARQILDAARARVDQTFDNRPEVFAALAATIADVDLSLGRSTEAADLLERAVQAAQRADAPVDVRQHLLIQHARALSGSDRLVQAQSELDAARALGEPPPLELDIVQGGLFALTNRPVQAIALLERSVRALKDAAPTLELANSARLSLAEAYRLAADDAHALQVLDATLAWQRAGLPASHPQIMRTRIRRVAPLRASGRTEESLTEALAIVADIEHAYGPDTPEAAFAQAALGRSLDALGRSQQAVIAYRKALEIWQRSLGRDHPNTLRAAFNLAYTLQLNPDTAVEAEALYRKVLQLATARSGPQTEMVTYYRLYLGKFLQQLGRPGEAFELLAVTDAWPGLQISSDDNRNQYLDTLRSLSIELECAARQPAAGNAEPDGLTLKCARVAQWLHGAPG